MTEQTVIRKGNLIIDLKCYTVTLNGEEISLCHREFELLCLLAQHPGWVFTKKQIYESIYGSIVIEDINNTIFCLIHSLRKKLEPNPQNPQYIKTVQGVGYKMERVDD